MNKLFHIKFLLSLSFFVLMIGCKDEYDWKKVEPGSQKISAINDDSVKLVVDTLMGNNFQTKTYKAISRGGSSYIWESSNNFLVISQNEKMPFVVNVKADSRFDTIAWLKVTEITWGGIKSKPDSIKIYIIGYCDFDKEQLIGNGSFKSKMTYYAPYSTTLAFTSGDSVFTNFNFFNMRWAVQYKITDKREQKIEIIPGQQFIYNDEWVEIKGSGYFNTCKKLFIVKYAVCYLYGDTLQYGSGVDSITYK